MLFECVCVQLASRYTPICLAANRCISIASARPKEHTSLSINYSLYINYTFVKALPKLLQELRESSADLDLRAFGLGIDTLPFFAVGRKL